MENLIKNSNWIQVSPNGGPLYFSGAGPVTFDNLVIDGNRTCSITLLNTNGSNFGADHYDLPIDVRGQACINWGYTLRVIDADKIVLLAKFYDSNNNHIQTLKSNITDAISYEFSRVSANFMIPNNATYVKLSMEFSGKVTACTFHIPTAYFC